MVFPILFMVLHFIFLGYVLTTGVVQLILSSKVGQDRTASWMISRMDGLNPFMYLMVVLTGILLLVSAPGISGEPQFPWIRVFFLTIILLLTSLLLQKYHGKMMKTARLGLRFGRLLPLIILVYIMYIQTQQSLLLSSGNEVESKLFWARLLHNGFGLLVVGGGWMAFFGMFHVDRNRGEDDVAGGARIRKIGALLVLKATLLQTVSGLWLMAVQPTKMKDLFNGDPESLLFMISLTGVLLLLISGVMCLFWKNKKWPVHMLGISLLLVLTGMMSARHALHESRMTDISLTSNIEPL